MNQIAGRLIATKWNCNLINGFISINQNCASINRLISIKLDETQTNLD